LDYDGALMHLLHGAGLRKDYFKRGYELFRDEAIVSRDHSVKADVLDTESPKLKFLEGKLEVSNSTSTIYVFIYKDQILISQMDGWDVQRR
jgi:hypothetical protein